MSVFSREIGVKKEFPYGYGWAAEGNFVIFIYQIR